MKLFLAALAIVLASVPTFAARQRSSFEPTLDKRLDVIEQKGALSGPVSVSSTGVVTLTDTAADGIYAKKVAKASFTFAANLAAIGATSLGVSLPAKAVITRSWIHVTTQLTDTGVCTVALSCEDANNIKTATDITGTAADGLIEGASTGTAATFTKSIAATCPITLTVADGGSCVPTAGSGQVFVEYVVQN